MLAWDKEEKKKAKEFSKEVQGGKFLKQPQAETRKKWKLLKTEAIHSADKEDKEDKIPEGFPLTSGVSPLPKYEMVRGFSG